MPTHNYKSMRPQNATGLPFDGQMAYRDHDEWRRIDFKASYYGLMVYAAFFGALSSLLTAGYITLYNQGVIFFGLPSLVLFNINLWRHYAQAGRLY
jgi:hypothetical protein